MQLKLNTKIILGFAIALGVLLLTSVAAWYSIQQLSYYTQRVEHTYQVLQLTSDLRMRMRDAQSQVRGYLLLNDTTQKQSFGQVMKDARTDFGKLQQLTQDNFSQQARLDTLGLIISDEMAYLNEFRTEQPSADATRRLVIGDRKMQESIKQVVDRMKAEEEHLLKMRRQRQDVYEHTTPAAIITSAVLAAIIVLWLFNKIYRELNANAHLQQQLTQANADVAHRIELIEGLAERVVQGDYKVKIKDSGQDSLGNLATSLNRMTKTLDENFSILETRNKELDQFAYVASHDLKAPLRGVVTVVKWIENELQGELSQQMRQYLDMMKGRLHRLEDLINGLLAYARVGRTEQKVEEVNVAQLVSEVTEMVVPAGFRVETPTPLPTLLTDRLSLQQVFTNLMGNAAKYHHKPEGTIRVSCQELKREYEFTVQDDGPGIAPQFHEKVFLMFQTLRDRNTAESTGIGLSIVKKILDEQKASIRIESEEGKGAAFIFTWPKQPPAALPLPL
ncbi:His Kinase A (phospho-acceptor) domain-containing protein [Hymenobacter gelipurpurascens]|uniref:histidine kinase n=1 Tax=Hymenobacter gelipurpurascens TaxID=89968 RepID=A0A212TQG5_9BACT|nr:ATP-binding protein [Hymenobacter gelipurpurascens]SNC68064.1 His Kinase A (phospho-acceptor) domain-containing protein [Hymenobacter gelipurpurascens]